MTNNYETGWKKYPVPSDGSEHPPDGIDGPLQNIGDEESYADIIQTFINQLDKDSIRFGTLEEKPPEPDPVDPDEGNPLTDLQEGDHVWYLATDDEPQPSLHLYTTSDGWQAIWDGAPPNFEIENWDEIDAGMRGYPGDETGGDIMDLIRDNINTQINLPRGRYSVESMLQQITQGDSFDSLALVGKPHATLVLNTQSIPRAFELGNVDGGAFSTLTLKNIDFEVDGPNGYDAGFGRFWIDDLVDVEDVHIVGKRDYYGQGQNGKGTFRVSMTTETGVGRVVNSTIPDGDTAYTISELEDQEGSPLPNDYAKYHASGFSSSPSHVGKLFWEGCHAENIWNNGFYVKDGVGPNIMLGCTVRNCGSNGIRFGKSDVSIGCQGYWDESRGETEVPHGSIITSDAANNTVIESLRVETDNIQQPLIRIYVAPEGVTIRDVSIHNGSSKQAIYIGANDDHGDSDSDSISEEVICTIDGLNIHEDTNANFDDEAIRVNGKPVLLKGVSYQNDTTSTSRAFISGDEQEDITIRDSRIRVPNNLVRLAGTESIDKLQLFNVDHDGAIATDSGCTIDNLRVQNCDLRNLGSLEGSPSDGTIDTIVWWQNLGWLDDTTYGSLYQNELHAETIQRSGEHVLTSPNGEMRLVVASSEPTHVSSDPSGTGEWTDGDLWGEPQ